MQLVSSDTLTGVIAELRNVVTMSGDPMPDTVISSTGLDSLDWLDLIARLEARYKISMSDAIYNELACPETTIAVLAQAVDDLRALKKGS